MPYVEAMACGCSVVAIDQPLTREILGDDTAVLLPDSSPQAMASAWAAAGSPPELNRRRCTERFSWEAFAQKTAAALELD